MDNCLHQTIESIIKNSIPEEVAKNIIDEGITLEPFSLLSEKDLQEVGFKIGARKLILKWIQEQSAEHSARSEEEIITLSSWKTTSEFLIRHMDPDHGLLNKFQIRSNLSFEKIEDVKSKETFTKRNAKLLSYILNDGHLGELIEALRDADQSHLANYLESSRNYDDKFKGDWPLKEKEASTLEVNEESLVKLLDPDNGLLASLYSWNVINTRQRETISSKQTCHEKNESLLGFLKRRSMRDYWHTIRCLHDTGQSHLAEILRTGGVVVQVHSKIEGIAKDLNAIERQISLQLTDTVLEKVPNSSIEAALRILDDVCVRLIAAQPGGSILLFFYCKSIEDFNYLEQLIISREIDNVIKSVYVSILPVLVDATVRASAPTEKLMKAKYFLKISEIWQNNHRIHRWMSYFSQAKIQNLPLEMLDIVLQKVYFAFIQTKDEQSSKRDEEIIKDLGSVDFCWFQRITRQPFKTKFWSHISKFYKTKCRISHNSRRDQLLIEQDVQINGKLRILKNADFLTDIECAMLPSESLKATKKSRFPFSRRLALVTSVLRNRSSASFHCISNNKLKLKGKHFDTGRGAPVRVEIRGRNSDESQRTIRQSVEQLNNQQFRDQSKQDHIETIGKDLKESGIEIINSLEDRPTIVWIWCKTPKSLAKIKELHECQKLSSAFRRATAEESFISNRQVNLDSDQFEQEFSALFQPSAAELAAKIDFTEENSESHLIFGVTKLMNKIYALCRKTDPMDFSDVASVVYVYKDEDPYPLQQTLTLKGITHPWDIGSSKNDNCFYVTESSKFGNNFVWKLTNHNAGDQSELMIEQWISFSPTFRPTTLSVSSHGQLSMVNRLRSAILMAYDSRGLLSLCVTLPKEVKRARHAVETTNGTFVILHATLKPKQSGSDKSSIEHKDEGQILKQSQSLGPEDAGDDENEDEEDLMWVISELSGDGKEMIRRFRPPSRDQMLEFPTYSRGYLCIDSEDRVLVADIMHHRVILFDSNLQWNRVLIPTKSELNEKGNKLILRRPRRMLYDEEMRQLVLAGRHEGELGEEINIFTVS